MLMNVMKFKILINCFIHLVIYIIFSIQNFNTTPLHVAAAKNSIECVEILIKNQKINLNAQDFV